MDYSQVPDLQLDAELTGREDSATQEAIETRLRDLHTALPGTIVSFDPVKQTAVVQPAIKRIFVTKNPGQDAAVTQVAIPPCVDVPVQFPSGGGFVLTFPVAAGDGCLLQFSERAIDFWFQNGGVQLPSEYRLHNLSDAIATVGLNSQPNAIPDFNASACELRTRDGATFIRIEAGQITIQGNLILNGDLVQTGDQDVTGAITTSADVVAHGISLDTHKHTGVQVGSGRTGGPVQ